MVETDWERELASIEVVDPEAGPNWRSLIDEARALADAVARHWHDDPRGEAVRPGLASALPPRTVSELREMAAALGRSVNEHALAVDLEDGELGPCAAFVLAELTSALTFLHDELTEDPDAPGALGPALAQLAAVARSEPDSDAGRAARLAACAQLASRQRLHLQALPGFDVGLIDEGHELAEALRARGRTADRSAEARRTLARRNRLSTLLRRRLLQVRRVAAFVLRHHREALRAFALAPERLGELEGPLTLPAAKPRRPALRAGSTSDR